MINKIKNLRKQSSIGQNYSSADIAEYNALLANGKIYTKFDPDDKIENQVQRVTGGIWSTGVASLTTHFTSSTQTLNQRGYYVDVFNADPSLTGSISNYVIAYGNALGNISTFGLNLYISSASLSWVQVQRSATFIYSVMISDMLLS